MKVQIISQIDYGCCFITVTTRWPTQLYKSENISFSQLPKTRCSEVLEQNGWLFLDATPHSDHFSFQRRKYCRELDGFHFQRFASTGLWVRLTLHSAIKTRERRMLELDENERWRRKNRFQRSLAQTCEVSWIPSLSFTLRPAVTI